jgi:sterol 3beta-glucosyltransferase
VFADQPFWGDRVFRIGAGPRPIPARRLTEEALSVALQATADEEIRRRASTVGERIRSENGVLHSVEFIQEHLGCGAGRS